MISHQTTIRSSNFLKKKFGKVIIWGLKSYTLDSFRYIHQSFYSNLREMGVDAIWCDDKELNSKLINKNDLVISVGHAGKHLQNKKGAYYCLHNFDNNLFNQFRGDKTIQLQVYTKAANKHITHKISNYSGFDSNKRKLYQPWGTDLLPEEFQKPIISHYSPFVFWIGSIWNNADNQGNIRIIEELKQILKSHNLHFLNPKHINSGVGQWLIRHSRLAPAIAGQWQVENGYLPCRMFKNISYGQLGFTNITKFSELFGKNLCHNNISKLVEHVLSLNKKKYQQIILDQQGKIVEYTYVNNLYNIANSINL